MKYKLPAFQFLLVFIICSSILLVSQDTLQISPPIFPPLIEPLSINKKCPKIKIWKIAYLEWNNLLPQKIVPELQPYPGGSYSNSNAPGPKQKPVRPYLKLYTSPGGILEYLERGDGKDMFTVVRFGKNLKYIQLPENLIGSLSARLDGGMWINLGGTLVHYNAEGKQVRELKNIGTRMLNAENDSVWTLDLRNKAWFISASGNVSRPYPWDGFQNSSARGQNICRLNFENRGYIECLEPNGKQHSIHLFFSKKAVGKILKFTDENLFTLNFSNTLSYYDSTGSEAELQMQNAGLTTTGEPFISLAYDDEWSEVCLSNGTSRFVPIKYNTSHLREKKFIITEMQVVAVDKERTLTFNYDRAEWFKGSRIEKSIILDENGYRKEVFPYIWSLNPREFQILNPEDGTVVMSVTGPSGIALIGLKWTP